MYRKRVLLSLGLALFCARAESFTAPFRAKLDTPSSLTGRFRVAQSSGFPDDDVDGPSVLDLDESLVDKTSHQLTLIAPAFLALLIATPVEAADSVPYALWAYAHYVAMLGGMGTVVAQRFLLKPGLTQDDESLLGTLNIAYGVFLLLILISGYERVVDFGKGVGFYSHEITFWLKMSSVGVLAALALFPTGKLLLMMIMIAWAQRLMHIATPQSSWSSVRWTSQITCP